jgi:diguanylate cyclase (GGDEF)-like protein
MDYLSPKLLISELLSLYNAGKEAYEDTIRVNLSRLLYMAVLAAPMSLVHIAMFRGRSVDTAVEAQWRDLILMSHTMLLVVMLGTAVLSLLFSRRNAIRPAGEILQHAVIVLLLSFGIGISLIDQLVTPSITPFLLASTVTAMMFLLRPLAAVPIYASAFGVFYWLLGLFQTDPALLLSNRVNALTAAALGIGLSTVLWTTYIHRNRQRLRLEEQQRELEAKNQLLQFMATHDEMTGLLNRKEITRLIGEEIVRMNRYGKKAAIILTDIDRFKDLNDGHGHPVGDAVLVQFSHLLRQEVRAVDAVSRWGGEEFLILMPETDLQRAKEAAERLRKSVEEHVFTVGDTLIQLTTSFGVAELPSDARDPFTRAYEAADKALYKAKEFGRNTVVAQD